MDALTGLVSAFWGYLDAFIEWILFLFVSNCSSQMILLQYQQNKQRRFMLLYQVPPSRPSLILSCPNVSNQRTKWQHLFRLHPHPSPACPPKICQRSTQFLNTIHLKRCWTRREGPGFYNLVNCVELRVTYVTSTGLSSH